MAKKTVKTNAMRMLEKAKISFEVVEYEVDEQDLSGEHVAEQLQVDPEMLFKTLVLHGDKTGYLVACIPVAHNIDLKKLARVSGNKKVEMIQVKDLLSITGYIRGGCSPIGMKKAFPTYVQDSMENFEQIGVSAGQRGMQILVHPKELIALVHGKVVDVLI